ncbi:class I SAM-dependent methyltransferase [Candidatus Uhrbacteria bacterium]|nr:class I SAM-dependent methyltransferase [Candidatus Uhrbacteria bacterium]
MYFNIRPSKCFLYGFLDRKLSTVASGAGLDAASASFKNRPMFRTERYYGLDLNPNLLTAGLAKFPDQNTFGIHCDLSRLERLPSGSASAIASTNTLYCLSPEDLVLAISHLCRLTAPDGLLICEMPRADLADNLRIFKTNFRKVEITYFKNIFSRAYERIFERNGFLGSHPIAGTRPFRLLAWLISRLEFLTCKIPWLNKHILIVCTDKIDRASNPFGLTGIPQPTERLYDLMA